MTRMTLFPLLAALVSAPALAQTPAEAPAAPSEPTIEVPVAAPEAPEPPPPPRVELLPTTFQAGDRVTFDDDSNDVFGMGETVRIQAFVADNALLMGGNVEVEAPVDGDVFGMGGTVRIQADVSGDVYALGGEVRVDEGATVAGNVFAASGDVRIDGTVGHDVSAAAGSVTIHGTVGGDVEAHAGELVLGDNARIGGDLDYEAPHPADNADDVVDGEITFTVAEDDKVEMEVESWVDGIDEQDEPEGVLSQAFWWTVWRFLAYGTSVLLGLVVFGLGGAAATQVGRTLREKPGESLGIGFATLMLLPPMSLVCVMTVVPSMLGVLGFLLWATLALIARVFVAQAIGDLILRQWRPEALGNPMVSMAIGLVPLVILFGVPWLGGLAHVAAASIGMGAVLWATRDGLRSSEA